MRVAPPDAFIVGNGVDLRALHEADAEGDYPSWLNDEAVCRGNSHHVYPYARESALEYIRGARARRDALILAIVRRDETRHIGNIALQSIDPVYRTAELAILLGDRSSWGKGFGKEAARLICAHGFRTMNLHRIYCGTFETNVSMRRVAEHVGMREEGRRRDAAFKDGRFVDVVEYGVLQPEFDERWPASAEAS